MKERHQEHHREADGDNDPIHSPHGPAQEKPAAIFAGFLPRGLDIRLFGAGAAIWNPRRGDRGPAVDLPVPHVLSERCDYRSVGAVPVGVRCREPR